MFKKFVPLTSDQCPSRNPYEVRTYMGEQAKGPTPEWRTDCVAERECDMPANSTLAKVMTLEDEIKRIHRRTKDNIFQKSFKTKCAYDDRFFACVVPQRTPQQLRRHIIAREGYINLRDRMNEYIYDMDDLYSDHPSIVNLDSPIGSEDYDEEDVEEENDEIIRAELASVQCSDNTVYIPSQKLLELKRPKSGIFINETEPPYPSDDIPYSTYNPRLMQEQFDAQGLKRIDLISGQQNDLWTWNLGLQQNEEELDKAFIDGALPRFDCINGELIVFKIPNDLDKTFTAGIVFGNRAILPEKNKGRSEFYNRPKEMACLYIGFVEGFRLNADFWTAATMDNIIDMAEKLVAKSVKMNYKSKENDYDIITEIVERQAVVSLKVHFTGPMKNQPNIYKVLSLYFSKYNAGILCSKKLYLLIWKRCKNFYYIYDPNGRTENCERDFENGKCALMSTHFVEHLVHLIVNIGEIDLDDEFNLYEILLTNFGKIENPLQSTPFPKRTRKLWSVVHDAYAVIPSCNYGLQQPNSAAVQNPSMLISVMALIYPYIERPNHWNSNKVDQLIRIGTAYYKSLRRKMKLKDNIHINIIDIPNKYVLGYFKASIDKQPFFYTGTVTDYCKRYMDSLLAFGLRELFNSNWEACLLQIDNSVVAIWRDFELFYVFDPFRRGQSGQVMDPDDYRTQGTAMLQMHSNFDSLLRVLYLNALKMRRGGKFFIHAVNVGCIKPIMDGKKRKLRYVGLKLVPEAINTENTANDEEALRASRKDQKGKKGKKSKKPPLKVCSIHSIAEDDRMPAFDVVDIVEGVIEQIICDILQGLPESAPARPHLYKCANKILLRSDKEYLKSLKYMVKHNMDYDNYSAAYQTKPEQDTTMISLKDELAIPSNFQNLPDGAWVIFGKQNLPRLDEEQTKLRGLLSALVTAALATKYKISTWTSNLLDYALNAVDTFSEEFQTYQYALGAFISKKLPRIKIGHNTYEVRVQKTVKSSLEKNLRQVLLECLIDYNSILVICQRFSCLIIKRYNFLYMFIGYPVNAVAYRRGGNGPSCVVRFVELDSLIRRIEYGCNPQGCDITNYVVVTLNVKDITPKINRYRPYPKTMEENLFQMEYGKYRAAEENTMAKMRFLEQELQKENTRIRQFLDAKQAHAEERATRRVHGYREKKQQKSKPYLDDEEGEEEFEEYLYDEEIEEGEEEDACDIKPKHKFGTKIPKFRDEYPRPRPVIYGYRLREKDYLYKIQGSKALEDRAESILDEIKPCFFASTLAILYVILRPLHEWTTQRIDQLIDSTLILTEKILEMNTAYERTLRSVSVDDYTFDVLVRVYEPFGMSPSLERQLESKAMQRYFLLHTANCTYAIHKDKYFHLFDPYRSMEITEEVEGEEEAAVERRKMKLPRGIKVFGERNTASWVLFADAKSLIKYLDKRNCNADWKEKHEYTFHVVNILSYKKSSKNAYVLQLLTGMAPCRADDAEETARCAHNESIAWLEHCLPVWSRLNRRNAAGRYRNMGVSKYKKYDIEIEGRLWSLWGSLHPSAPVFDSNRRGKQFLACCVVSLCAANLYRLIDWSPQLLDSIVINGDRFHQQSLDSNKCEDYEISLEDLNIECWLDNVRFVVHVEHVVYGKLYTRPNHSRMNLAEALMYFFTYFRFGILQCFHKYLAIGYIPGPDSGYFMYDCQSRDHPLYPKGQGASNVLRTKHLQVLLYCLIVTLNVPYYNVLFTIHKVDVMMEGASTDDQPN